MNRWKWMFCLCAALVLFMVQSVEAKEIIVGYSGPLSGPAAEYGQDCFNGIDMAVKEINAAGGITVKGEKYTFRLDKLDDRIDQTQAVINARLFQDRKAIALFQSITSNVHAVMKLNEEKGHEILLLNYINSPSVSNTGNKLAVALVPPFTTYLQIYVNWAWERGYRKLGIMLSSEAGGDEWSEAFQKAWKKKGGVVTAVKPANYYVDVDYSAPLVAILSTKPDFLLIGGPSPTTALVIDQVRGLGYKGGLAIIDHAKLDYIEKMLKGTSLFGDAIGVAMVDALPSPGGTAFAKKYTTAYNKLTTWEAAINYMSMHALSRAVVAAGTVDNIYAIRNAYPKAFPLLADKYPSEAFGIGANGRMFVSAGSQTVKDGKFTPPVIYAWWVKNQKEYEQVKKASKVSQYYKWLQFD